MIFMKGGSKSRFLATILSFVIQNLTQYIHCNSNFSLPVKCKYLEYYVTRLEFIQ